jgi:hypothetical protein
MTVPAGALAVGAPAVIKIEAGLRQQAWIKEAVRSYLAQQRRRPHGPATVRCSPGHAGDHSPCAPGGKRQQLDAPDRPGGSHPGRIFLLFLPPPGYWPPSEAGIGSSGMPQDGAGRAGAMVAVPGGLSCRWITSAAAWMVVMPYCIVGLSSVSTTMV